MSYLIIVLILGLLILIHELGHLLAAKIVKIPIARFSIGFGPKLWGFSRRNTEYWISVIPLGGYVLPDLDNEERFFRVSVLRRVLFSLGGPMANIATALVALVLLGLSRHGFSLDTGLLTPLQQVLQITIQTISGIPFLFSQPENISSVVGIVSTGGDYAGLSFARLASFSILLNVNLAIFNLLPIPPLDGGKIILYVAEKIYRPIQRIHIPVNVCGWLAILAIAGYATVQDIVRIAI